MRRFVIGFVIFCMLATAVVAWDDCPYGVTNDPYPGLCRRYVDTNHDDLCDHSQIEPASIVTPPTGDDDADDSSADANQDSGAIEQNNAITGIYHVIPIAVILTLLYTVTYLFSKKGIIKLADHRRLWNWALLATFLISAILGMILAICINFGWTVPFSTNTLFYHVELGIAMTMISIYHILWHWNYWKGRPESKDECKKKKIQRN